jgi:hypothetical protein
MLLERIDIDAHGALHHVELGPFAAHLNVISGPRGSGKTAIARFIRDSLVRREYPQGMLSASSGRVVWADGNGLVHCRREPDGTPLGRRTVEFENRGNTLGQFDSLGRSWFSAGRTRTAADRAIDSLQLPESIVDGVITDTAITSVARIVSACVRSGLDSRQSYQSLPLHDAALDNDAYERSRRLRRELADIDAELTRLRNDDHRESYQHSETDRHERLSELHDRARRLRAQQSELLRWVAEIDRERSHANLVGAPFDSSDYQSAASITDGNLRRRLEDLDAQLIRWRRALSEVRGIRHALLSDDQRIVGTLPYPSADEAALRRLRMEGFLHAIDHYDYDHARNWDEFYPESFYPESHRPLHQIDEIEYRIESATRQIDWLLQLYADPSAVHSSWYHSRPAMPEKFAPVSLGDALRNIRQDLHHVRMTALSESHGSSRRNNRRLTDLQRSEQSLVSAIEQLHRQRESLLCQTAQHQDAETTRSAAAVHYHWSALDRDRRESAAELDHISNQLTACLREAAEIRHSMRYLPIIDRRWVDDQSATLAGMSAAERSFVSARTDFLRRRRHEILAQLRIASPATDSRSPLSVTASTWLVRLSGGRLRQVSWPVAKFARDSAAYHAGTHRPTGVTIDGRDEQGCAAADRALAVLAVRMAAGELLSRRGRPVPLVLESDGDLSGFVSHSPHPLTSAYQDHGDLSRSNSPLAAALRDYARDGRQLILLTSNQSLADELARIGARTQQLRARPVVHAHRPLWKSQHDANRYVGPHPQLSFDHRLEPAGHRIAPESDVNRDFDTAWRETYGVYGGDDRCADQRGADFVASSARTDWPRDGYKLRDGYYVANSFTTNDSSEPTIHDPNPQTAGNQPLRSISEPASPFFLTVDSPIDQAPSIDAVAAARLRALNVTHINHLMQHDSNRLADALGLASVDAATIRRWQAECRLVCRVPQLRGFDARVLVGCGVSTPAQLAAIHPVDLLQQVEAFLSTERGQQILLSGSSRELSRITTWIATANSGDATGFVRSEDHQFDSDRYEYDRHSTARRRGVGDRKRNRVERSADARRGSVLRTSRSESAGDRGRHAEPDARSNTSLRSSQRSPNRAAGNRESSITEGRRSSSRSTASERTRSDRHVATGSGANRGTSSRSQTRGGQRERRDFVSYHDQYQTDQASHGDDSLRFFLNRDSFVVDAPSIGARMAERLHAIGIETVNDLLNARPETVAQELGHRRIGADTVLQWQQQAQLVCRVPMLRGHDAQLLVAADITTPEALAACDPVELFEIIDPIARGNEGKRILRGGRLPDLAEITDWINYGQQHRALMAA